MHVQSSQRPQIAIHWGEPERAPHKRYSCARIVYGAGGGTFVRPTYNVQWLHLMFYTAC